MHTVEKKWCIIYIIFSVLWISIIFVEPSACPMQAFAFDSKQKALDGVDARNRTGVPARPVFFLSFFSGCIIASLILVWAHATLSCFTFLTFVTGRHFDTLEAGVGRGVRLNRNSKQPAQSVTHLGVQCVTGFAYTLSRGACLCVARATIGPASATTQDSAPTRANLHRHRCELFYF